MAGLLAVYSTKMKTKTLSQVHRFLILVELGYDEHSVTSNQFLSPK